MHVFDRAHFDAMTGGDDALQHEVIALFRGQVGTWSAACASNDWRDAVHTLKGSARGIGLHALADACEAAEGDTAELERVAVALREALAALDQFAAEGRGEVSR